MESEWKQSSRTKQFSLKKMYKQRKCWLYIIIIFPVVKSIFFFSFTLKVSVSSMWCLIDSVILMGQASLSRISPNIYQRSNPSGVQGYSFLSDLQHIPSHSDSVLWNSGECFRAGAFNMLFMLVQNKEYTCICSSYFYNL